MPVIPCCTCIATGGGGGVAFSAGTQLATSGTVIFSNSNGVSFGMSNSSVVTASVAAIKTLSAGTTNATGPGVSFGDANGVSFGVAGNTITGSISTLPETPFGISAGTQSVSTGTVVFSNSNNVTFGMAGSSQITASFSTQPETPFAISAGTQSVSTGTLVFSNSNGISFGMDGSSQITASVAAQTDYTHSQYNNWVGQTLTAVPSPSFWLQPRTIPNLAWSQLNVLMNFSANAASVGTMSLTYGMGVYTKTASSLSRLMSTSFSSSASYSAGAGTSLFNGARLITVPWTSTLSQGDYWFGFVWSTTNSSDSAGWSHAVLNQGFSGASSFSGMFGSSFAGTLTVQPQLGLGAYTALTTAPPAVIAFSEIRATIVSIVPAFGLGSTV